MDAIIKERAQNKAYAKKIAIMIAIKDTKLDLERGTFGGVTKEETELILKKDQVELEVWEFISESIDKNN